MIDLFPPRPGITLYYPFLPTYSPKVWLAQRKFKGQRNLIYVPKSGKIEFRSRHAETKFQHRNYTLTKEMIDDIMSLNLPRKDLVIDSELLHAKTKGVKDTVVLFDVLVLDEYLADVIQTDRIKILYDICNSPVELEPEGRAISVRPHVWLAETIQDNFMAEYKRLLHLNEIEGLVLRRRNSKLREDNISLGRARHDVKWMVRVRKSEKGYHH